jgi:hypothetical protein
MTPGLSTSKAQKEVALECPAELITAFKDGTIYRMLEGMNTNQIKLYCELCGVPRSGAKYKIQALLLAHVKKTSFASCHDSNTESGALTLKFAQMSFARAHTKFCNLNTKLKRKGADARTRWETIVAAARGVDQVIYTAITGPNRKAYNGSCGEAGIEADTDVGMAVCEAFVCAAAGMSDAELDAAIDDVLQAETKCTPYGFDPYSEHMKMAIAAAKVSFDLLPEDRQKRIEALLCEH